MMTVRRIQPTIEQRIEACQEPVNRSPVMYQKWRDLLFLHWDVDPDIIQKTLPSGLSVDTFDGKAYLGVVPFFMKDIRPRYLPAVSSISNFLELNLRTYVFDKHGRPGVWFYSLDATQWLAVRAARTLFNLPYFDAVMSAPEGAVIDYSASRKGCSEEFDSHFVYSAGGDYPAYDESRLEYFLIERYLLFAVNRKGDLFSGKVHHTPYPLKNVILDEWREGIISLAGFDRPERTPDHAVMSKGVDVSVYAIEKVV